METSILNTLSKEAAKLELRISQLSEFLVFDAQGQCLAHLTRVPAQSTGGTLLFSEFLPQPLNKNFPWSTGPSSSGSQP